MHGVTEYAEGMSVNLVEENGRLCVEAANQCGYDVTQVDLIELLSWLWINKPELMAASNAKKS